MKEKRLEPIIAIRLKGLGQTHVFHPGDTLSGVVEILPDDVIKCRQIVLTVGWRTEGRGDINQMTIHEERLPVTTLNPETPLTHHFDVVLPPEPWSYAGTLIRIVWYIHVKADIAFGKDYNQMLQFVLEPTPIE